MLPYDSRAQRSWFVFSCAAAPDERDFKAVLSEIWPNTCIFALSSKRNLLPLNVVGNEGHHLGWHVVITEHAHRESGSHLLPSLLSSERGGSQKRHLLKTLLAAGVLTPMALLSDGKG